MDRYFSLIGSILLASVLCLGAVGMPVETHDDSTKTAVSAFSDLRFTAVLPEAPPLPGPEVASAQPDRQGRLQPTKTWQASSDAAKVAHLAPYGASPVDADRVAPQPTSAPRFLLHCSFLC